MKEVIPLRPETQLQAEIKKEQKKQLMYFETMVLNRGHKLFEVNLKEGTINEAVYHTKDIVNFTEAQLNPGFKGHHKLVVKPDCIYIGALNKKNVEKQLIKRFKNLSK